MIADQTVQLEKNINGSSLGNKVHQDCSREVE